MSVTGLINIENNTIVTGVTSTNSFLVAELNDVNVGLPLYTFTSSTPNIDLVDVIGASIELPDATLVTSATSYGAGVALTVNASAAAVPLYKIEQGENADLLVYDPIVVDQMSSTGTYFTVKINGTGYGIPIHEFSSVFPSTTVDMSAVDITTILSTPTQDTNTGVNPSTFANSKINTYSDLIKRIKYTFGYPHMSIELCDDQFSEYIDQAVELYTKYAGMTEEFMMFDSNEYPIGRGIHIPTILANIHRSYQGNDDTLYKEFIDPGSGEFRKCAGVFSIDTAEHTGADALFSLEYIYAQQVYYSYMLGSYGFDLVTWEALKQFLDLRKKMFSTTPRMLFDVHTQRLRVIPEPVTESGYLGIVGLYLERPVKDALKERWVQHYAEALSKIAIGNIRGKFSGVTLFGGAQINGTDLLSQGLEEKKELESEILDNWGGDQTPAMFFLG